jgi:ammonium transporter, Amt family
MLLRSCKWFLTLASVLALTLVLSGTAFAQGDDPSAADLARSINTVWVLVTAFLVFFMQAGFALVEAGFTRSKNTTNILMKNLVDFIFATIAFWAIGYAFMFGTGTPFIGLSSFFTSGLEGDVAGVPILAFWLFQLVFAGTAATIVSGAMAERTRFKAYLIYSAVISGLIYPIFGHWVWGSGWLWTLGADLGFMPADGPTGFRDFAGSTVVHSVGGWCALVGAWMLGPRLGRFNRDGSANVIAGHSMALGTLGVFILWLGWFGFNPGSQLAAVGSSADTIALVAANTNIAAAAGGLLTLALAWLRSGKPDLSSTLNGVLGGLVAITAPCAFVTPLTSVIIGAIGGALVVFGAVWLERAQIDDPVGAVPVHLINGIWGTLALGLFATDNGLFATGQVGQLIAQVVGVVACGIWSAGTAYVLFAFIKATAGLRVSAEEEIAGLDQGEHGTAAYPDLLPGVLPEASPGVATAISSPSPT